MTTETTTLDDGASYSWESPTGAFTDVAVTITAQPVDLDVESKRTGEPDSAYSRVEQFSTFYGGPLTVTSTGTKTLTIPTDGEVIRVTVTNNTGETITPNVSVTPASEQQVLYEDGKAMVDAKEAQAESLSTERAGIDTTVGKRRLQASLKDYNPHPLTSHEHSGPAYYKEHPHADNPVFTASDAATTVDEVADVFARWIPSKGEYHLILEGLVTNGTNSILHVSGGDINSLTEDGTITVDGTNPAGSWPYFFKWNDTWYAYFAGGGDLTKQNWSSDSAFLEEWTALEAMGSTWPGGPFKDPTFTYYDPEPLSNATTGRWWVFAGEGVPPTQIVILYSETTDSAPDGLSWTEHTTSPITAGGDGTKQESPAGRPIAGDGYVDVVYYDNSSSPEHLRKYRYSNVGTGSGTMVETEIGRVSTGNQFSVKNAGQGTNHAIDHIIGGPSGGADVVFMDVGTPWEIVTATPANHPPVTDMEGDNDVDQTITATTWETVDLAGFTKDILQESDAANDEINIIQSGWYRVGFYALFAGAAAGDKIWVRMRNTTDGSDVIFVRDEVGGSANPNSVYIPGLQFSLTGGKTYEFQVQNRTSDDTLKEWRLSIERVVGRDT